MHCYQGDVGKTGPPGVNGTSGPRGLPGKMVFTNHYALPSCVCIIILCLQGPPGPKGMKGQQGPNGTTVWII